MLRLWVWLETLRQQAMDEEAGQGLAEYGLILALIAVVAIVALTNLGTGIVAKLAQVTAAL